MVRLFTKLVFGAVFVAASASRREGRPTGRMRKDLVERLGSNALILP